jgi:tetratricopeptide (TPR) repeat protein
MSDDRAWLEKAATSENEWVRARILKQDPPAEGSLLKIAERGRDMAARALGEQHPAYAIALQNLGLYYEAIENNPAQANALFAQARAVLGGNDLPLAEGFYWLGIFHTQVSRDLTRAQPPLMEALAIRRRVLGGDDLAVAETMIALAHATDLTTTIEPAIALLEDALKIQRSKLAADDQAIRETEKRLVLLQALARAYTKNADGHQS